MMFINSVLRRRPSPPPEPKQREVPTPPEISPVTPRESALGLNAKHVLGYEQLHDEERATTVRAIETAETSRRNAESTRLSLEQANARARKRYLAECALASIGVVPFETDSVERYKRKVEYEANRFREFLLACSLLLSLVISVFGFPAAIFQTLGGEIAIVVGIGVITMAMNNAGKKKLYAWQKVPLRGYSSQFPVASHALETALSVARRIPATSFFVDELAEQVPKSTPRPDIATYDPFLVVRIDEEDFYLEVWNEPRFNGKRA